MKILSVDIVKRRQIPEDAYCYTCLPALHQRHPGRPVNARMGVMNDMTHKGWIGVDLDGTLAYHDPQQGLDPIGKPIEATLFRVRQWLDAGIEVRIFTARAGEAELIPP